MSVSLSSAPTLPHCLHFISFLFFCLLSPLPPASLSLCYVCCLAALSFTCQLGSGLWSSNMTNCPLIHIHAHTHTCSIFLFLACISLAYRFVLMLEPDCLCANTLKGPCSVFCHRNQNVFWDCVLTTLQLAISGMNIAKHRMLVMLSWVKWRLFPHRTWCQVCRPPLNPQLSPSWCFPL